MSVTYRTHIALHTILRVISVALNNWLESWFSAANNQMLNGSLDHDELESIESNPYENIVQAVCHDVKRTITRHTQSLYLKVRRLTFKLEAERTNERLHKNTLSFINHKQNVSAARLTACHRQKDSGDASWFNTRMPVSSVICLSAFSLISKFHALNHFRFEPISFFKFIISFCFRTGQLNQGLPVSDCFLLRKTAGLIRPRSKAL